MKVNMKGIKIKDSKDTISFIVGCEVITDKWETAREIHETIENKLKNLLENQMELTEVE